jgi:undecaprenyl-diphosphatase
MELFEIIALSIIQGLTEFLPVSSSGHLVAVRVLFGISDVEGGALDAFLHMGTLLAVLVYFWSVWWGILRGIVIGDTEGRDKRELAIKLIVASVPAGVVGYFFADNIDVLFRSSMTVAFGLILTALLLILVEVKSKRVCFETKGKILDEDGASRRASFIDALLVGVAQVLALLPGVSRSGITIAAGRGLGLSRKQAIKFSFLMSAPIIAGAGATGLKSLVSSGSFNLSYLLIGFIVSFVCGLGAIFLLLKLIERITFWPFIIYLIGLAGLLFYVG